MKDHLEVLAADQASRIDRIKDYHGQFRASAEQAALAVMLCGFELTILKGTTPHGQFGGLRDRYFPEISERTTRYYMALVHVAESKSATVADLIDSALRTPHSPLPAPAQKQLTDTFREVADSKTVTQLYREAGLIKTPPPPGGFRPDAKLLKQWLKDHHPELDPDTKFDDLPVAVRKEFQKQYRPKLDPELEAQNARDVFNHAIATLAEQLDSGAIAKHFHVEQPEHADQLHTAAALCTDLHKALVAHLKHQPLKRSHKKKGAK